MRGSGVELEPNERLEYRRLPDVPGAEVLIAERCLRRWRVFHETYSVCSLTELRGAMAQWRYRGGLHESGSHSLMLIEPGETHVNPSPLKQPGDFRAVFIAPQLVEQAAIELGMRGRPHLERAHSSDPRLFEAFGRFHRALDEQTSGLERESRLAQCVRLLIEECSETPPPELRHARRAGLARVRDLIHERYAEPIRLADLADISGMSRFHLAHEFAREFGLPPHAYQLAVQVQKAKWLLSTGYPLAQAAADTGFADQSHMTRHFKRILGVTPGSYCRSAVAN